MRDKILLIEDSEAFQRIILRLLQDDFEVESLLEATNAIDLCMKFNPNLILLDIMLPGEIDGLSLLRTLKLNEHLAHIPVILISALASNEMIIEGLKHGANDYLVKPFDLKQLVLKVKNLLRVNAQSKEKAIFNSVIKFVSKEKTVDNPIERFDAIIEKLINTDNNLSVPDIAKQLNMSHSTLTRLVKAKFGITPNIYIVQRKLEKAKLLLNANKRMQIKEIAFLLGFNSVSYFSKCFKKYYNYYPSNIR